MQAGGEVCSVCARVYPCRSGVRCVVCVPGVYPCRLGVRCVVCVSLVPMQTWGEVCSVCARSEVSFVPMEV